MQACEAALHAARREARNHYCWEDDWKRCGPHEVAELREMLEGVVAHGNVEMLEMFGRIEAAVVGRANGQGPRPFALRQDAPAFVPAARHDEVQLDSLLPPGIPARA